MTAADLSSFHESWEVTFDPAGGSPQGAAVQQAAKLSRAWHQAHPDCPAAKTAHVRRDGSVSVGFSATDTHDDPVLLSYLLTADPEGGNEATVYNPLTGETPHEAADTDHLPVDEAQRWIDDNYRTLLAA